MRYVYITRPDSKIETVFAIELNGDRTTGREWRWDFEGRLWIDIGGGSCARNLWWTDPFWDETEKPDRAPEPGQSHAVVG